MNIRKIEADFLKGLFSTKSYQFLMTEYEGKVGYSDSYFVALVPDKDAFVKCVRNFSFEKMLDRKEREQAEYTYTITAKAGNLARYKGVDGQVCVYIDVKYTKYFSPDAEYWVAGPKDLVHVFENDELVGIICPVNIKEEEN